MSLFGIQWQVSAIVARYFCGVALESAGEQLQVFTARQRILSKASRVLTWVGFWDPSD